MGQPHKHAELIKAWAENQSIVLQTKDDTGQWVDCLRPGWFDTSEYRIKPEPPKYPQTKLTDDELLNAFEQCGAANIDRARFIANAAIARAIEDGDVVPAAMLDKVAEVVVEAWAQDVTDRYPGPDGYSLSESEKKSIKKTMITRLTPVVQSFIRKAKGGA